MKTPVHHTFVAMGLSCLIAWPAFAEAPVVDESENYALFDEQLAATERPDFPLAQAVPNPAEEERIALAFDDTSPNEIPQNEDVTLLNKLQTMQQEVNNLRGQLEVQVHELQTLKQQQLDFYKDLDSRIREPNTSTPQTLSQHDTTDINNLNNQTEQAQTSAALSESTAPRGNPADEQISYLAAYELIKSKEFDKAVMAMNSFISQYPRGGYTANAHYWLGELYMVKKAYPDAIQQFQTVLKIFPSSSKTSDCSLKIGYALLASGQKNSARQHLQDVIRDYPDTHAAELAAGKLENINS
ncbi:MAG: tol-pal system protein YbgF [Legionellaceae bacterium]|nr:tol-pal system protein YbgF [Legionellaceae bacterium]